MPKSLISVVFLMATLLANPIVLADDEGELEAAFEKALDGLNDHDLDAFLKAWHPGAVLVAGNYVFPVDRLDAGDELWAQIFEDFFETTRKIRYTPVNVDFRVLGSTGLVWGFTQIVVEPKEGPDEIQNLRLTASFVKSDGKWLIASWHNSVPPERNPRPGD
jgi:uncharacterized protein (TIGR02246 family)